MFRVKSINQTLCKAITTSARVRSRHPFFPEWLALLRFIGYSGSFAALYFRKKRSRPLPLPMLRGRPGYGYSSSVVWSAATQDAKASGTRSE